MAATAEMQQRDFGSAQRQKTLFRRAPPPTLTATRANGNRQ
ncbi:hypothetical protein [Mesorhizobium sp. WSM3860]|nr:hypothetical protein [Mesorhizobium sp. WSM3860]